MIIDLQKKYAPHLNHWPTWLIDDEAFDLFLSENKISTPIVSAVYAQRCVIPSGLAKQLSSLLKPRTVYELRMPSPLRVRRITNYADLESALKEFWADLALHAEKSKELKLYEELPKTIFESHVTKIGHKSAIANLHPFPMNFQSFMHKNNHFVWSIAPVT